MNSGLIKKLSVLLAAMLVVVAAAYGLAKVLGPAPGSFAPKQNPAPGGEPVFKAGYLETSVFPPSLPIETAAVLKDGSYTVKFPESRRMTQYTISYLSSASRKEKYREYLDYMKKAGFDFGQHGQDPANLALYGIKNNDDLAVTISTQLKRTLVQITYLDRQ